MKNILFPILLILIALTSGCNQKKAGSELPMEKGIGQSMEIAEQQAKAMAEQLIKKDSLLPRTINKETGELITSDSRWWCSSFFPGTLWYLYEYTEDEELKEYIREYTSRIEREKHTTDNHDVGFMLHCSFGNGLRITGNENYEDVLVKGSESLSTRFNGEVGLIRSWDFNTDIWQYPVIIDNMMNLELLMWAFQHTGDFTFRNIAVSHADKTLKHHFREDHSSYHVVSYDTITGKPHFKGTHQGAADSSIWARGQSWGLYGYTMMYRETGNERYLTKAINIADMLIHHPNMPEDKIPYWDFLAPEIPNTLRDASAAAIMASALIELSTFVNDKIGNTYLETAEQQIRTLASKKYLAEPDSNGNFILKDSVGSKPHDSEVDVALTYADYYFIEALMRYKNLSSKDRV